MLRVCAESVCSRACVRSRNQASVCGVPATIALAIASSSTARPAMSQALSPARKLRRRMPLQSHSTLISIPPSTSATPATNGIRNAALVAPTRSKMA